MSPNNGTLLYHAADALEAERLCEALDQNGIQSEVIGGALVKVFGDLGADALRVDIWVPADRVQEAMKIVRASLERSPKRASSPWTGGTSGR